MINRTFWLFSGVGFISMQYTDFAYVLFLRFVFLLVGEYKKTVQLIASVERRKINELKASLYRTYTHSLLGVTEELLISHVFYMTGKK
jgi:hypothetical protein